MPITGCSRPSPGARTRFGQKDHKIADDLLISVGLCRGMKDFDRALVILRRVQSLHVEAYTADSPMVADDFSRMGNVYAEQKNIDSAIGSIAAALAIRTKLSGPLDPVLIPDLDRLGEYNTLMRAYDQAEAAFRHALVIRETLYGKTHPDLISTVDGLAYALFGQQKYDEADPVYQRLIGLWESSVGKDHAMVAVALDKVAAFYSAQKKYPEVREALERSTAIRARFLAMGISQQAIQAFTEEQTEQTKAFYRRGLAVLDPPNPINDDLRAQFEGMLKAIEAPPPKSGAPVKEAAHSAEEEQQALIYSGQELIDDRFPFGFGRAGGGGGGFGCRIPGGAGGRAGRTKGRAGTPTTGDGIPLARSAGFTGA